jgi:hypothetical protein
VVGVATGRPKVQLLAVNQLPVAGAQMVLAKQLADANAAVDARIAIGLVRLGRFCLVIRCPKGPPAPKASTLTVVAPCVNRVIYEVFDQDARSV